MELRLHVYVIISCSCGFKYPSLSLSYSSVTTCGHSQLHDRPRNSVDSFWVSIDDLLLLVSVDCLLHSSCDSGTW